MEAIPNIIYNFLETNRRITVPALGTFLTKGDRANLLFSEFIKSDDGVLQGQLVAQGLSGDEASAQITKFVADVRAAIESGGGYDLGAMGQLRYSDGALYLADCGPIEEVTPEQEEQILDSIFDSLSSIVVPEGVDDQKYYDEDDLEAETGRDVWLLVALAGGVIAILALLYGVVVEWQTGDLSFGAAIDGVLESIF